MRHKLEARKPDRRGKIMADKRQIDLYEALEGFRREGESEVALGPERKRLRKQALIRELLDNLNAMESENERREMIQRYILQEITNLSWARAS